MTKRQEEAAYQRGYAVSWTRNKPHTVFDAAQQQIENLTKVKELVDARVAEGRELAIESKRANFNVANAKHGADVLATRI